MAIIDESMHLHFSIIEFEGIALGAPQVYAYAATSTKQSRAFTIFGPFQLEWTLVGDAPAAYE